MSTECLAAAWPSVPSFTFQSAAFDTVENIYDLRTAVLISLKLGGIWNVARWLPLLSGADSASFI